MTPEISCACLTDVDDAPVAAGRDHHEAAILHVKDGGVLMVMLVGHDFAEQFGGRVMAGVAAEPVLHAELSKRLR